MKKLLVVLLFFGLLSAAHAQQAVVVPTTEAQISITGTASGAAAKIISGITGQSIYVTAVLQIPVATSVVTYTTGTGSNCGTGTASITGAMTFAAGQVLSLGTGNGAVWVIPSGNDLCVTITTAAAPGSIAYSQF